jgi:hypothetical protein
VLFCVKTVTQNFMTEKFISGYSLMVSIAEPFSILAHMIRGYGSMVE